MKKNERGITLVELMIVVAIIGVLAAIATIAYGRYIKSAKVERLTQYAHEVASGQERYRARNNAYWPVGVAVSYSAQTAKFNNLLDFTKTLPSTITVQTQAWSAGGSCSICDGMEDLTAAGFGVRVEEDMNPNDTNNTTVIITNSTENPILLFEGS